MPKSRRFEGTRPPHRTRFLPALPGLRPLPPLTGPVLEASAVCSAFSASRILASRLGSSAGRLRAKLSRASGNGGRNSSRRMSVRRRKCFPSWAPVVRKSAVASANLQENRPSHDCRCLYWAGQQSGTACSPTGKSRVGTRGLTQIHTGSAISVLCQPPRRPAGSTRFR